MSGICSHSPNGAHWIRFEPPNGEISNGLCRYCRKKFVGNNWEIDRSFNPKRPKLPSHIFEKGRKE